MTFKSLFFAISLCTSTSLSGAYADTIRLSDEQVMPIIRALSQKIDPATDLLKKRDGAKPKALWNSKAKYQDKLNDYVDDALSLILPDTYPQIKNQLISYEGELRSLYAEQSEWREVSITGVVPSDTVMAKAKGLTKKLTGSVFGHKDQITSAKAEANSQIEILNNKIKVVEQEKKKQFSVLSSILKEKYGIELSDRQAQSALIQVNGKSIVEAQIVPHILHSIELRLKELQSLNPDPKKAQEYYGVAVISRLVMLRLYEKHLSDYDDLWIPKIIEINDKNSSEIENLSTYKAEKNHNKVVIQSNIDTRYKLKEAINAYRKVLAAGRDKTQEMLKIATEDAEVAIQTLNVLKDLSDFSSVTSKSLEEYFALSALESPDLLPLDNDELINQFIDISGQLAKS